VRDADAAGHVDEDQARGRTESLLELGERVPRYPRRLEPAPR